jgi:hypothetical protein
VENKARRVKLDLKAQPDLRAILVLRVMQVCRVLVVLRATPVKLGPRATRAIPESKALRGRKAILDLVA